MGTKTIIETTQSTFFLEVLLLVRLNCKIIKTRLTRKHGGEEMKEEVVAVVVEEQGCYNNGKDILWDGDMTAVMIQWFWWLAV